MQSSMKGFALLTLAGWMCFIAMNTVLAAEGDSFTTAHRDGKVIVSYGESPVAEYVFKDPTSNKTYLWPVYGPTGKAMTRAYPMKVLESESEKQRDHYHHRGIWFGHEGIDGANSWAEAKTFDRGGKVSEKDQERLKSIGYQKQQSVRSSGDKEQATIVSEIDYVSGEGKKSVTEVRTMVFRIEGDTRLIDIHQVFTTGDREVVFDDKKDAGLSIRVPTTMAVDSDQGGTIVNSEGKKDKDAWGKRAKWCDYSGPVEGETLGVTMLNHPSSFRHPTTWHVRTYGLFTANPFGTLDPESPNGPHTLKPGEKLEMRHRFILHDASFDVEKINAAYEKYAEMK